MSYTESKSSKTFYKGKVPNHMGEGSLQMFGDEMFVEVFGLNIMIMFVVMEMVLVLQYYGAPLQLLFVTFKCN